MGCRHVLPAELSWLLPRLALGRERLRLPDRLLSRDTARSRSLWVEAEDGGAL
jgi:hypothetical protein